MIITDCAGRRICDFKTVVGFAVRVIKYDSLGGLRIFKDFQWVLRVCNIYKVRVLGMIICSFLGN